MKGLILALVFALSLIGNSLAQQTGRELAVLSACDYKVEILVNGSEFASKDFNWKVRATKIEGAPANITGTAEINDLNGRGVRKYRLWSDEPISKQKTSGTYTPNLNVGEYKLVSRINVTCIDSNDGNNADIKAIKIKENYKTGFATLSSGQNISADVKIDNNSTDNAIKDGTGSQTPAANQPVESKTMRKEQEQLASNEEDNVIQLRGDNVSKFQNKFTADAVKPVVYESSNEKAKSLIVPSLLLLSVVLNIVLIWKR